MAGKKRIALLAAIAMIGQASVAAAAPGTADGVATNRTALAISTDQPGSTGTGCRVAADGTRTDCADEGTGRSYIGRSLPVLLGAIAAASLGIVAAVSGKSGAPASP